MPSKVELFQVDSVEDDVFGSSSSNPLDISLKYPKLPKKDQKMEEIKGRDKESQAASLAVPTIIRPPSQIDARDPSGSTVEQSKSLRMEDRNIHDGIQKGEELESPRTNSKTEDETGNSSEDSEAVKLVSFDLENEYLQRQLKSTSIGSEVKYLKIKCHQNHTNKLNVFNQIGILTILCYGKIVGYESEYISGLKNINPSEAILIDMMLNKKIAETREDPTNDPYSTHRSIVGEPKIKSSILDVFDDKIAALTTAKNKAVNGEDYVEAEKLKQIIVKIEKLKVYIQKLEVQKLEHANNENYDQAKKLKNEIDRIKNVVLSITSGSKNMRPKIIPPMTNAQQKITLPPKMTLDYSIGGTSHGTPNERHDAYGFADIDNKSDIIEAKQQSFANLKANNYKRSGILKMKKNSLGPNLDNSYTSNHDVSGVNSTVNLSYNDELNESDDPYFTDGKKHVRIMDPKDRYALNLFIYI